MHLKSKQTTATEAGHQEASKNSVRKSCTFRTCHSISYISDIVTSLKIEKAVYKGYTMYRCKIAKKKCVKCVKGAS